MKRNIVYGATSLFSILLITLFSIALLKPTEVKAQCNDCIYIKKTAACWDFKFPGTGGTTLPSLTIESGAQIKCKSGEGSCTPQLCE